MAPNQIPPDVFDYVRRIFYSCNARIGRKISSVPNTPEPSLDLTLIEQLSHFSSPRILPSDWTVRIDTHYLGGLRHYAQWEIADIGILLFLRRGNRLVQNKVALLQSKRLYPDSGDLIDEDIEDYRTGMFRLVPNSNVSSMNVGHVFVFSESSVYRALRVRDKQWLAIQDFQGQRNIPTYYLFYNPWSIPFEQTFPLSSTAKVSGRSSGGCRVIPANILFDEFEDRPDRYSPRFREICGLVPGFKRNRCGWRIEYFVSRLLLGCIEGRMWTDPDDIDLQSLFFRRSGPISAAVGVNVEMPEGTEWNES